MRNLEGLYKKEVIEEVYMGLISESNNIILLAYRNTDRIVDEDLYQEGLIYRELAEILMESIEDLESPGILEIIRRKFR